MIRYIVILLAIICVVKEITMSSDIRTSRDIRDIRSRSRRGLINYFWNMVSTNDPDAKRNTSGLISSKGYPVEEYDVQTKDGYILTIQRIPHGKRKADRKGVALLMSGLLGSSADMVLNFENQSIAFILADAGYDVWLANNRGNNYGERHISRSSKSRAFWDFSFQEMAEYDLPAMIDFILDHTKESKLYFAGLSQGTVIPFALLAESPEYNQKIKVLAAMGPGGLYKYIRAPNLRFSVPLIPFLPTLGKWLGSFPIPPSQSWIKLISKLFCDTVLRIACETGMFYSTGPETPSQFNRTRLGVYGAHYPTRTSLKNAIHFGELIQSGKFHKFDYGRWGNMQRYNQPSPPEYYFENITAPVALFWAENDYMTSAPDVRTIQSRLRNLAGSFRVEDPDFTHLDFLIGINAKGLVYDKIIRVFQKY